MMKGYIYNDMTLNRMLLDVSVSPKKTK